MPKTCRGCGCDLFEDEGGKAYCYFCSLMITDLANGTELPPPPEPLDVDDLPF